jgi:hypothetical protein
MGSFRVGQVANSLSQGLGLFAEKSMREEQARIDREWDLALASMREESENKRSSASMQHAETLHKQGLDAATTRHAADTDATAAYRQDTMTAAEKARMEKRSDDMMNGLQKTLLELSKMQAKELEEVGYDPAAKATVMQRYTSLRDEAITGTVVRGARQALPGFSVASADELQSLLIQNGMDMGGARDHSQQMWKMISAQAPTDLDSAVARGEKASDHLDFLTDPELLGVTRGAAAAGSSVLPPPSAAETSLRPTDPSYKSPGLFAVPGQTRREARAAKGSSPYGYDPNYDWTHGLFDNPRAPKPGEDPYALMGRRPQ